MSNDQIIKTHIWHGEQCFFVSTLERESSAMEGPRRYNETIVWAYNWEKRERGELLHMDEDSTGSIRTHQRIVEKLFEHGEIRDESE